MAIGASISVENIGTGKNTRGQGTVKGNSIRINNFATSNGKVSAAGDRITWSDGVVWKRVPDLNGEWTGYYDDGTRSPFRWSISQSGIGINIQDAKGGSAKSRGTLIGLRVTATYFATKNGTLSADGQRITWSDGVVWIKE